MNKYFISYQCGSDLLVKWLSLFLVCHHLISETIFVSMRIRVGSEFKRFLCFVLIDVRCLRLPPEARLPHNEVHCCRQMIYTCASSKEVHTNVKILHSIDSEFVSNRQMFQPPRNIKRRSPKKPPLRRICHQVYHHNDDYYTFSHRQQDHENVYK
jgi:hypothetical protein